MWVFLWVLAHVGVKGNEVAGRVAGASLSRDSVDVQAIWHHHQ